MIDIETYEYLVNEKARLQKRKERLSDEIRRIDETISIVDDTKQVLSSASITVRLGEFIKSLSELSSVEVNNIVVNYYLSSNKKSLMFNIYSIDSEYKFGYYNIEFPLDFGKRQADGKVLKDHLLLSQNNNGDYSYFITDEDELLFNFKITDIMHFSDGKENHPKNLFKDAVMKSMIRNKDYDSKQKKLIKNQNN